jgi:hypothetical protein
MINSPIISNDSRTIPHQELKYPEILSDVVDRNYLQLLLYPCHLENEHTNTLHSNQETYPHSPSIITKTIYNY